MSRQSLPDLLERKSVRFFLAAVCLLFTVQGVYLLLTGQTRADLLRGGGQLLLWGGWAIVNVLRPYGKTVSGINTPINIGLVLIVASWIFR